MPRFNHTTSVNACRDEQGVVHHTFRAMSSIADLHQFTEPISRNNIRA